MIYRVFRCYRVRVMRSRLTHLLIAVLGVALCTPAAYGDAVLVKLRFTAPGDDGRVGQASAYDVRYSTAMIDEGNWAQATKVPDNIPSPRVANTPELITVTIPDALLGTTYHVAIKARDEALNWSLVSNSASFYYGIGSGTGDEETVLPDEFALQPSYPNPFNASTRIEFDVPEPAPVTIRIWNALGQHVRDLVDGEFAPGTYEVTWDGTDRAGHLVPSGTYFYQLISGRLSESRRMTLLK